MKENKLEELIKKLCPNGVEYKKLEDCCNILDNERKPVTKSARIKGEYPYYGANGIQDYVSDYIFDGTFVLVGEDGSVINKNGNPVVTWAEGKIWVNNHAHVIKEKENVLLRYLYHYIQTINVSVLIHGNIPKLNQGDFRNLRIAVPPLEVQCEIVHILDDFTLLSAELSAELKARQKQYDYYSEKLLNNIETKEISFGDACDVVTDYVAAGSFGDIAKNVQYINTPDYAQLIRTVDIKNNFQKADYIYVSKNAFNYLWRVNLDKECVILPNIGVNCGEVYYLSPEMLKYEKNVLGPNAILVRSNTNNIKYLSYLFKTRYFQKQLRKIISPAGQTKFNKTELKKLILHLPSKEIQENIVEKLDKLDEICNNIYNGLPAEIEARQKQYEYYRDKLLTFKELKVNE